MPGVTLGETGVMLTGALEHEEKTIAAANAERELPSFILLIGDGMTEDLENHRSRPLHATIIVVLPPTGLRLLRSCLTRRWIDHLGDLENAAGRQPFPLRLRTHALCVRSDIYGSDPVPGDEALHPLNPRTRLTQHPIPQLGYSAKILSRELPGSGKLSLDDIPWHRSVYGEDYPHCGTDVLKLLIMPPGLFSQSQM